MDEEEEKAQDQSQKANIKEHGVSVYTGQLSLKRQNFKRLANARSDMFIESLRKLTNLASPNYEYTEEDVNKLFSVLEGMLNEAKSRFTEKRQPRATIF